MTERLKRIRMNAERDTTMLNLTTGIAGWFIDIIGGVCAADITMPNGQVAVKK